MYLDIGIGLCHPLIVPCMWNSMKVILGIGEREREREGESERESKICDGLSEAILLLSWACLRPPSSSAIHCSAQLC